MLPCRGLVVGAGLKKQRALMATPKTVAILLSLCASAAMCLPNGVQAVEMRVGGIHPGFVGHLRPGWARPAHFWWRPGGAVAAGAAIGFISATMASDWAGPPPAPGYCWYYTDITRWYGFWDECP